MSNYDGLTPSFARRVNAAFQVRASFTWSHAMDDISNGGFFHFNFDSNTRILAPQDPTNFRRCNYGNADCDVRRQFNLSYVYHTPKLHGVWDALLDWTISGTFFGRSGLPFTVVDGALGTYNYGPFLGWTTVLRLLSRIQVIGNNNTMSNAFSIRLARCPRRHCHLRQGTPEPGLRPHVLRHRPNRRENSRIPGGKVRSSRSALKR